MSGLCPACDGRSDDSLICNRCTTAYEKDLRQIPGLMRELETTLTRQSQTGTGNGGKGAVRPLPFDANASVVGDEVKNTLVIWVRTFIIPAHGDSDVGDEWPDDNPISICAWLHGKPERIRGHEEAPEFIDEIADVVRTLRRAIDLRPEMVYLGACKGVVDQDVDMTPIHCLRQMYARKRDESYDCPDCGMVYNVKERRDELLALAADQLATIGTCAQFLAMFGLPVRVDTIDSWTRPRTRTDYTGKVTVVATARLWRRGQDDRGVNLYLVGEVEALAREMHDRKQAREQARRAG